MRPRWLSLWGIVIGLTAAYCGAGRLGQLLAIPPGNVTAVWLPSGIAVAAILVFGCRVWPGIWVGAVLVNTWAFFDGTHASAALASLTVGAAIGAGATLQALLAAILVWGLVGPRNPLERVRDVVVLLVLGGVLACTVSPSVGVTSLCLGGFLPWEAYGRTWLTWWLGDTTGVVIAAPFLLAWSQSDSLRWLPSRRAEGAAVGIVLVVVALVIFGGLAPPGMERYQLEYLLLPLLLWAGLRLGLGGATAALLLAWGIAIWGTVQGHGPFLQQGPDETFLPLQVFIAVMGAATLVFAALIQERGEGERQRRQEERRRAAVYAVTHVLAESPSLADATPRIAQAICESLGWEVGAVWIAERKDGVLRCVDTWHEPSVMVPDFIAATRNRTFARGVGLPGRVWVTGQAAWIANVTEDTNFPRAPIAIREGLRGAFAIPILLGQDILGVIEFFSREIQPPDDDLLKMLTAIGSQVGQFIERKQAEEGLQRRERELTDFLENATVGLHWVGPEGTILWANRAELEMLGYPREEYIGQSISKFHADRTVIDELLARLREGHELHNFEARLRCKDGTIRIVLISSNAFFQNGKFQHTRCFTRDITERKRAEEEIRRREQALRDSEERYRDLFENANDVIYTLDMTGCITSVNRRGEQMFGWTLTECRGRNVAEMVPPEYHTRMQEALRRKLGGEAAPTVYELELIRKDGRRVPLEVSSRLIMRDGQAIGVQGIARDITDRQHAEQALREIAERLRLALAAAKLGDWSWDAATDLVTFSEQAAAIFGIPPGPHMTWTAMRAMLHAEDQEPVRREVERTLAERAPYDMEFRLNRPDGTQVWVAALGHGQYAEDGRVLGMVGVVQDISTRKALEEELHRRVEQLAEVDRRKDEFMAILGHELRNPLAPLRNALEVLKLQNGAGLETDPLHDMMERQVRTLARLTDELLDISRVRRGKVELRKEVVDLATIIGQAVEASRPLIEQRGQEFTVAVPPEPLWLEADPVRIEQVLANLLTNAAKFTSPGGRIWLQVGREAAAAVIQVRDTGIGIRSDILPQLFQPFQQADRLPGRIQEGLGLGLALVRGLVELHGGTVSAASAGPGQGSEFVVSLPLLAKSDARIPQAEPVAAPDPARKSMPGRRVLVVDDNVDVAETLALLLQMQGHQVTCAHDGPTALQLAEQIRPDIVFLDIGMPGMDGYQVGRLLRSQPATEATVLVAMTGYGQEEDRRRSFEAGFDYHLVKPVEPAELRDLLARVPYRQA